MAQLMPMSLTVSCFSKIQIGFSFLVPAHPGSPGKGPLNGCVCVSMGTAYCRRGHLVAYRVGRKSGPQSHGHDSVKPEPI